MGSCGLHLIRDVVGASSPLLKSAQRMREFLRTVARSGGAIVVSSGAVDLFGPPGVSVFVGLNESHISLHSSVEGGRVAVDVFTCGESANGRFMMNEILGELGGEVVLDYELPRFRETDVARETGGVVGGEVSSSLARLGVSGRVVAVPCEACGGRGRHARNGEVVTCGECEGRGTRVFPPCANCGGAVTFPRAGPGDICESCLFDPSRLTGKYLRERAIVSSSSSSGRVKISGTCSSCMGSGRCGESCCPICGGDGTVSVHVTEEEEAAIRRGSNSRISIGSTVDSDVHPGVLSSGSGGGTVGVDVPDNSQVDEVVPEVEESAEAWSGGSDRLKTRKDVQDEDTTILEGGSA